VLKVVAANGTCQPRIFCDACDEPIVDARQGCYAWRVDDRGAPASGELRFLHDHCRRAYEAAQGGRWTTEELARLPVQLSDTLALDWRKLQEWMESLG
jgi:hypothetical protein